MLLLRHDSRIETPFESLFITTPPQTAFGLSFHFTLLSDKPTGLVVIGDLGRWPIYHVSAANGNLWFTPSVLIPFTSRAAHRVTLNCFGKIELFLDDTLIYSKPGEIVGHTWAIGTSQYMQGSAVYGLARVWDVELRTEPLYGPSKLDQNVALNTEAISELEAITARMESPAVLKLDLDNFGKTIRAQGWQLFCPESLEIVQQVFKAVKATVSASARSHYKGIGNDEIIALCDEEEAVTLADKLRTCVQEGSFGGLPKGTITVSIGIGVGARRFPTLYATAGVALAKAKSDGKNCVWTCNHQEMLA